MTDSPNIEYPFVTRSSASQFYKGVVALRSRQKEAVKEMGFEKLLSFGVIGVTGRIAHYVVDNFDPIKCVIRLPNGKIKVTPGEIHNLLGIPNTCVDLDNMTLDDILDPSVKIWKKRYSGCFIAPTAIVTKIKQGKDFGEFNFKMDFQMLFLTVMVDCLKQGSAKLEILHYLDDKTDFKKINWCLYMMEALRGCKEHRSPVDDSIPFTGPLCVLMLLYVDRVECGVFSLTVQ